MIFRKFLMIASQKFSSAYRAFLTAVEADGGMVEAKTYTDALLQTASNASIVQIPSAYKATVLYNQVPTPTGQDFTVARASDVTRINEDGVLEVIGSNVPCIDYSDGFPVLLTQPQSTNLITYSNDFSDVSWGKTRASIVVNDIISPDGTLNADKLVEDTTPSATHIIKQTGSRTVSSGATVTNSVFVKANGRNWVRFSETNTGGYYFDIQNGVVGSVVGTPDDYSIIDFGNGWYRISITITVPATLVAWQIFLCTADGAFTYTGDGVSGIYMYSAQIEELSYPTTIIPTSGASATRLADVITGAGSTASINSEEGVLHLEIAALADTVTQRSITLGNGGTTDYVTFSYRNVTNQIQLLVRAQNAAYGAITYPMADITVMTSIDLKWKVNDFELYVDGVSVGTDVSGLVSMPNTLNDLSFTNNLGVTNFYGKTKDLRVYSSIAAATIDLPYIT